MKYEFIKNIFSDFIVAFLYNSYSSYRQAGDAKYFLIFNFIDTIMVMLFLEYIYYENFIQRKYNFKPNFFTFETKKKFNL